MGLVHNAQDPLTDNIPRENIVLKKKKKVKLQMLPRNVIQTLSSINFYFLFTVFLIKKFSLSTKISISQIYLYLIVKTNCKKSCAQLILLYNESKLTRQKKKMLKSQFKLK